MKAVKLLPAILLMATLGVSGMAYAQETGGAVHKEPDKKEWEHHHHGGMWNALPEEKRKLLHETMEKVKKENAPLHEQKRKLHAELDAIMVAPQFDSDAFTKKTAELDDLHNKMKENRRQAFTSILGQFSQEERVELVVMQHMMKMKKHHHHHGHHHHDGKGEHGEHGEHGKFHHDQAGSAAPAGEGAQ